MKIITKEEEAAHYSATLRGGFLGGLAGLAGGSALVYAAHLRYPAFRSLTLPLKAFLVTSSGTFLAITNADSASRAFETSRRSDFKYQDQASRDDEASRAGESPLVRGRQWARENRYGLLAGGWVVSMAGSLAYVRSNRYLSTAQKLVQARVAAQGLTVALMLVTAALEIGDASGEKGRYETVKVLDPDDPEHKHLIEKRVHHERYKGEDQWKDMIAAEEERIHEQDHRIHEIEEKQDRQRKLKKKDHKSEQEKGVQGNSQKESKEDGKKDDGKGDSKGDSKQK